MQVLDHSHCNAHYTQGLSESDRLVAKSALSGPHVKDRLKESLTYFEETASAVGCKQIDGWGLNTYEVNTTKVSTRSFSKASRAKQNKILQEAEWKKCRVIDEK